MNLQTRALIITVTSHGPSWMSTFIYLSAEGNVAQLSSTLPRFTRPCDRRSGNCSNPICTICITIQPVINRCKSSYMLLQIPKLSTLWWLGSKGKKERTFQFKVAVYFSSSDRPHNGPSCGIFYVPF